MYFSNYSDLSAALINGKINAFLIDEPAAKSLHSEQPKVDYIKKRLTNNEYSFAFRKNDAAEAELLKKFNEFLAKANADGTIAEIDSVWFGSDDSKKVVDMSGLDGKNGTIHVVTTSTDAPFSYIKDGKNVGYDIDVVVRFCREYGYALELGDVDFPARIPALASGKYEFTTSMNVTPERKEEVLFSDPVSTGGIVVAVRSQDVAGETSVSYKDYAGKTIGVGTGSMFDVLVEKNIPDAKVTYFNTYPDMVTALEAGKVDAVCIDEPIIKYIMATEEHSVSYIKEPIEEYNYGFAFPKTEKGRRLRDEFNEFLRSIKSDGTLSKIENKWFSADESSHTLPEIDNSSAKNGVLRLSAEALNMPFVYLEGKEIAGYEIDIAYSFCKQYGYGIEVVDMSFDAIIPALTSGICDFGCSNMNITEERAQSVYFSEPDYVGGAVLAVRSSDIKQSEGSSSSDENTGFIESIKNSFEKNFIREDRYKLILEGIGTTCLITVLSALFGTVLAFLVCMFRRTGSRLANVISNIYVKLLQGTPMVVLLMILYYIIFGRSGMSAIWVAIIGFTLNFGAYVSEIMRSGIESIDGGQREAALALGYSENQTFFKFIFPQAAVRFLPVYKGELISLLKSTSIVGYIAIQDLTKMSDIIRSRTYEAFFPLIVTAVIYFILAWILSIVLNFVFKRISPKRKKAKGGV